MKLFAKALSGIRRLRRYVDRPWYPFVLGTLTFLDFFVVFVPSDGIIVASAVARPKKWFTLGVAMALGSLIGGVFMAELSRHYGESFITWISPGLLNSEAWEMAETWLENHGIWALFLIAASPLAQQPSVLLAGLTDMPITHIGIAIGSGRLLKFLAYAWIASHTPKLLKKIPALSGELEELEGVSPQKDGDSEQNP